MSYLVLARKWRPQTFEDLVGQETIAQILKNAISQNKVAHAYIFSGPRGVGKTTTARILAKALNCINGPIPNPCGTCRSCAEIADGSSMDVFEIDGASNTGVDHIRDLRERIRYAPSGSRFKVYIIDEAHMLSTAAFNALLKTLEEPPPHVIFVLATTEPKKIPPTVLSRCQHLPFKRISSNKIKERLRFISNADGIKATDSALEMIARAADGSMRDSLTMLDQIASFSQDITESEVKDLLGITDTVTLSTILSAIIEGDRKAIINIIAQLIETGTDLKALTKDLLQFARNLLISKISEGENIVDISEEESNEINKLKDKVSEEHLAVLLSEMIKAEPLIRSAFYPRVALEMSLIRLSMLSHLRSVNEALKLLGQAGSSQGSENQRKENKDIHISETETKILHHLTHPLKDATIQDIWNETLKKIGELNHPLYSKLVQGDISFENDRINLIFSGGLSIHAESVKENLKFIKNIINELSGKDINLQVKTVKTQSITKKDLKEKALNNEVIRHALELFEARIIDVIPSSTGQTPEDKF